MNPLLAQLLANKFARLAAGGMGAVLAALGGLTTIQALQPAVEKAADYAARGVELYCELPRNDRERFRNEVTERLANAGAPGHIALITCAQDP